MWPFRRRKKRDLEEAVARAIMDAFRRSTGYFPPTTPDEWRDWCQEAKAAIEVVKRNAANDR